jgi:FkbM family methyltransferase
MSNVRASVIIPAHDAATTLGRQLEALAAQVRSPPFEVLVVANRCADGTAAVAASFRELVRLRIIVADELASAAYARNVGAAESCGRYLLFCDADDQVDPAWVAGMVEPLEAGRADVVGGRIRVDRSGLPDWIYRWRYAALDERCIRESPARLPYAVAASLAITREAFVDVGGFDVRFAGAGAEEVDLCWRLLRAGYRIGEAPDATIRYEPRKDFRKARSQARGYARGGLLLDAKEGTLVPRPSPWTAAEQVARTIAHRVIRQGEFHPLLVSARSLQVYDRWVEHRRLSRELGGRSATSPSQFDFCVKVSTPIIGGLAFTTGRAGEARWYSEHGIERRSLALVERFLPEGGVFVDVGANVGVFTVAAARRAGEGGRVVAFEPNDRTRPFLTLNLQRHRVSRSVEVRTEAVGDAWGTRSFRSYENSPVSGFGSPPETFHPGRLLEESTVRVTTLSDAVEGAVDMVKIDVEGFEAEVLSGAEALLARSPDAVLLLELNPASLRSAGRTPAQLLDALPPDEWDLWLVDEGSREPLDVMIPFDRERWARDGVGTDAAWYANVLATRSTAGSARGVRSPVG